MPCGMYGIWHVYPIYYTLHGAVVAALCDFKLAFHWRCHGPGVCRVGRALPRRMWGAGSATGHAQVNSAYGKERGW